MQPLLTQGFPDGELIFKGVAFWANAEMYVRDKKNFMPVT